MPTQLAETHRDELFYCGSCRRNFPARIATWVDVSRTPQVKKLLQNWEFNVITCPHCGNREYSDSPFFYEDFAKGLLVAVFPSIPEDRSTAEAHIRQQYGYYPTLEFFYDMTQLWFLIYLQEHYKTTADPGSSPINEGEEKRLQTFLQFVKKDPLMLAIRETLNETFSGSKTGDDLQNVLWCALLKLEGMSPGLPEALTGAEPLTI